MVAVATSTVLRGSLRSAFNGSSEILPRACRVATARRMTGRFEHFDARPGGSYGLLLAYADASVPREVLRRLRRSRPKGGHPSTPDHASCSGTASSRSSRRVSGERSRPCPCPGSPPACLGYFGTTLAGTAAAP